MEDHTRSDWRNAPREVSPGQDHGGGGGFGGGEREGNRTEREPTGERYSASLNTRDRHPAQLFHPRDIHVVRGETVFLVRSAAAGTVLQARVGRDRDGGSSRGRKRDGTSSFNRDGMQRSERRNAEVIEINGIIPMTVVAVLLNIPVEGAGVLTRERRRTIDETIAMTIKIFGAQHVMVLATLAIRQAPRDEEYRPPHRSTADPNEYRPLAGG
ncbi:hypothetical protein DAPPUDRAFT_261722 [Daphnia pulex]|uniref:Uncharacterized protein n=1 Tax=Daphnia pulex TaxID=6669 RepID=E9HLJ4_DAPPU|nr:hypothetical protein DAPPUDRAFT_261722 [Daphnia pulex]|eukprot:EFX67359.1 hypothetical protein DAPPUDRAFT_261722 [Daphnia pulex]